MSRFFFLLREALVNLKRNFLVVAGAVLAVFISLSLAFGALVVNEILRLNTLAWQEGVHVIAFLNDEWDENKKIGDTNLFVQGIEVNGVGFSADELKTETPDAASEYHGYMALWRRGSVRLDVDAVRVCG